MYTSNYPKYNPLEDLEPLHVARIKFFNYKKGYGFLYKKDGGGNCVDLFFHVNDFKKPVIFERLDRRALVMDTLIGLGDPDRERVGNNVRTLLSRNLVVDEKVLFKEDPENKNRPIAAWTFELEYSQLRAKKYAELKRRISMGESLPVFVVQLRTRELGPPRADNARKCMVQDVKDSVQDIFHGNNVEEMYHVLAERIPKMNHDLQKLLVHQEDKEGRLTLVPNPLQDQIDKMKSAMLARPA